MVWHYAQCLASSFCPTTGLPRDYYTGSIYFVGWLDCVLFSKTTLSIWLVVNCLFLDCVGGTLLVHQPPRHLLPPSWRRGGREPTVSSSILLSSSALKRVLGTFLPRYGGAVDPIKRLRREVIFSCLTWLESGSVAIPFNRLIKCLCGQVKLRNAPTCFGTHAVWFGTQ